MKLSFVQMRQSEKTSVQMLKCTYVEVLKVNKRSQRWQRLLGQQLMASKTFIRCRKGPFGGFLVKWKRRRQAVSRDGPERRFRTETKIHINKNRRWQMINRRGGVCRAAGPPADTPSRQTQNQKPPRASAAWRSVGEGWKQGTVPTELCELTCVCVCV